jgi:hypothetical protein
MPKNENTPKPKFKDCLSCRLPLLWEVIQGIRLYRSRDDGEMEVPCA